MTVSVSSGASAAGAEVPLVPDLPAAVEFPDCADDDGPVGVESLAADAGALDCVAVPDGVLFAGGGVEGGGGYLLLDGALGSPWEEVWATTPQGNTAVKTTINQYFMRSFIIAAAGLRPVRATTFPASDRP